MQNLLPDSFHMIIPSCKFPSRGTCQEREIMSEWNVACLWSPIRLSFPDTSVSSGVDQALRHDVGSRVKRERWQI